MDQPRIMFNGTDPMARKRQLAAQVEEFFNHGHDKKGRFAPSSGGQGGSSPVKAPSVDRLGPLGPSARFRKRHLKKLSDGDLRKLHAHLEVNSRKWGAALVGVTAVAGVFGLTIGIPLLGPVVGNIATIFLTRTRERYAVANEGQRRGINLLNYGASGLHEFKGNNPNAQTELDKLLSNAKNLSPEQTTKALHDGLQALKDLLSDPEEELTDVQRRALRYGQTQIERALLKNGPSTPDPGQQSSKTP